MEHAYKGAGADLCSLYKVKALQQPKAPSIAVPIKKENAYPYHSNSNSSQGDTKKKKKSFPPSIVMPGNSRIP